MPLTIKQEGGCLKIVPVQDMGCSSERCGIVPGRDGFCMKHRPSVITYKKRRSASWLRRFFRCRLDIAMMKGE